MEKNIINFIVCILVFLFFINVVNANSGNDEMRVSPETEECLMCHMSLHPGIVTSWESSLHSKISPLQASLKDDLKKRVSSLPEDSVLASHVVGCYECHSINTKKHSDSFEHNGYTINVVVSPDDCATCHQEEREQYSKNIMAHAYANLMENEVYQSFKSTITGSIKFDEGSFHFTDTNNLTDADACLHCHGTVLNVKGKEIRETDLGEMEFPVIEGWPNQGVGRINPDGSKGSCTSCHPRHDFSIETARKPHTCAQCHKGPDAPAYKVYKTSKHGNIYDSKKEKFNFSNVPWVLGTDFTAPTCAACHASLIVNTEGEVIAERTHQFNDRLSMRLFGVPYAQAHPISPQTHKIKNSSGLQLASDLDGTPASSYLINKEEQFLRDNKMKKVCNSCHSSSWTNNHFARLSSVIESSNEYTKVSTDLLIEIWNSGYADNSNLFDENIERYWTEIWLIYANSIRLSAAMSGGGDYGVFADGRYQLTNKLIYMQEWLSNKQSLNKKNKRK